MLSGMLLNGHALRHARGCSMKLKKLALADKGLFRRFLRAESHELSVYSFENIFIWKGLFEISWGISSGNLCVFFKDKIGSFMYLPPLGRGNKAKSLLEAFALMGRVNENEDICRVENIEEKGLGWFKEKGFSCYEKPPEYLCLRQRLADLKGDNYKSKRAACNYFEKNYSFECTPYADKYKKGCLKLYEAWVKQRSSPDRGALYKGMLSDARVCLKSLLDNFSGLNLKGITVIIGKEIKAFTFGFEINRESFCVLFEVADLSLKGIAQLIFREFCRQLKGYKYINIMDDSGLENLKRVKLSYHPFKPVPGYVATKKS